MNTTPKTTVAGVLFTLIASSTIGLLTWGASTGSATLGGQPVLLWCGALAVCVQWLVWLPSAVAQTERFFDITGTITYLATTGLAVWATGDPHPRSLLVLLAVWIWALRLGVFLVRRVHAHGDPRFDELKIDPMRFLVVWNIQAMWVALTALGAWIVLTSAQQPPLGPLDLLGLSLWAVGMALEVVADRQKAAFNADPANQGAFIDVGLWAWSQHPNYFGEIVLWTGLTVVGCGVFSGGGWLGLISPLFVTLLLTRVSGIPLLDKRARAKFGDDPHYAAYVQRTSKLIPLPPRRG